MLIADGAQSQAQLERTAGPARVARDLALALIDTAIDGPKAQ
jgi:hypothetical protein